MSEFGEWIIPFVLIQAFCQTFLIHRQGVNVNAVNAVSDVIQHFLFDPVAHIGNDNVGAGTFAAIIVKSILDPGMSEFNQDQRTGQCADSLPVPFTGICH